jgi:hypothetical protein
MTVPTSLASPLVAAGAAMLAACAAGGTGMTSAAEQQCGALVRYEGLRLLQVDGVESRGADGEVVRMRVEDAFGRKFSATCAVAGGAARWAQPLPSNVGRG